MIVITIGLSLNFILKEVTKSKHPVDNSMSLFERVNTNKENNSESNNTAETIKIDEATYSTIETISLQDFERKVLAKEDMNVIVSSSTCYYCLAFEPIVHEVLTELGKKVYRINTYALNDEDLKTFRSYYPYTTTPTIFTTKDGNIKNELVGARNKEKFMEWAKDNLN